MLSLIIGLFLAGTFFFFALKNLLCFHGEYYMLFGVKILSLFPKLQLTN